MTHGVGRKQPCLDAKRLPHIGDRHSRRAVIFRIGEADLYFELWLPGPKPASASSFFASSSAQRGPCPSRRRWRARHNFLFRAARNYSRVHGAAPNALGEELAVNRHG